MGERMTRTRSDDAGDADAVEDAGDADADGDKRTSLASESSVTDCVWSMRPLPGPKCEYSV